MNRNFMSVVIVSLGFFVLTYLMAYLRLNSIFRPVYEIIISNKNSTGYNNTKIIYIEHSSCNSSRESKGDNSSWSPHRMIVIIPFRDCWEELNELLPYMDEYLNNKSTRHSFYVANQVDNYRFNRASLINAAFLETFKEGDYVAIHDVDLLPVNKHIRYDYPEKGPFHVTSPKLHPHVHYKSFVGGIILFNKQQFLAVNGMSNRYWGWGSEDDDLEMRIKRAHLKVYRPTGISTGNKTFKDLHRKSRKKDKNRYFNQSKYMHLFAKDKTGVSNVKYEVQKRETKTIKCVPFTMIHIKLTCDLQKTPWCLKLEDHDKILKNKTRVNSVKTNHTTVKSSVSKVHRTS